MRCTPIRRHSTSAQHSLEHSPTCSYIFYCSYGAAVCLRHSSYVISTSPASPAATSTAIHTPPAPVQLRLWHARQQCIPFLSTAASTPAPAPAATISWAQVAAVWLWQHCSSKQHRLCQQPSPAASPAPTASTAPSLHPPATSVQLWLQHAS